MCICSRTVGRFVDFVLLPLFIGIITFSYFVNYEFNIFHSCRLLLPHLLHLFSFFHRWTAFMIASSLFGNVLSDVIRINPLFSSNKKKIWDKLKMVLTTVFGLAMETHWLCFVISTRYLECIIFIIMTLRRCMKPKL